MNQIAYTMPEAKFRSTKKRTTAKLQVVPSFAESQIFSTKPVIAAIQAANTTQPQILAKVEKPAPAVKTKKSFLNPVSWWPVAVGLFLTGFASDFYAVAAQGGIWVLRAAFPLSLLANHSGVGLDTHFAASGPQLALYLQLPLEGLLTKLSLDRGMGLKSAIAQLTLVHGVCVLVLWMLTMQN